MSSQTIAANLDPRGYLERINFSTPVSLDSPKPSLRLLRALHEAHMLAVPFENLSIHYGQPIVLRDDALYDKIVRRHRGGFCYELNGLFAWLLRRLGFEVSLLAAGVAQADGNYTPKYDHLTLLVHQVEGADWITDVGFGDSFRQPLRLQADVEQDGGDGRIYRLHETREDSGDQDERQPYTQWTVQQRGETGWESQYRFTLQPHGLTDFNERCHFQQTSPASHFTQRRLCSLALPQGRVTLSDLRLITTIQGHRDERAVQSEAEYRETLAERFGVVW
jgi:N-hydroxyarylamine O-acetyltransferase